MRFCSVIVLIVISFLSCNQSNNKTNSSTTNNSPVDSANNWALSNFIKADSVNPILQPGKNYLIDPVTSKKTFWEARNVFNPAVIIRNDTMYMLYRAQDSNGTSRIGLAYSIDGFHFVRYAAPVLFPANDSYKKYEWPGGCEDPRVVQDSAGTWYMTYTAFDGKLARLFIATSTDLFHWTKHGSVFSNAYQNKYVKVWSKSGSIVSTYTNDGKIIAVKVNGKYLMYWGDQFIWSAISTDLIHWTPIEMNVNEKPLVTLKGQALNMPHLRIVLPTRNGKFDCDLVECGPPAMLTDKGILLIYNSRNISSIGDTSLPEGTYAAGQVLFDKKDPSKILYRLDNYFMKPDKPYEFTGQVNNVCFLEGLALFQKKWFLYYGTADSKIAVAVKN